MTARTAIPELGEVWPAYVAQFHRDRAGITEALLAGARDARGRTPYQWLAESVVAGLGTDGDATLVDLGCGSGPTFGATPRWVGIDASIAELGAAVARDRRPVTVARVDAVPLRSGTAQVVVSAMALMVVDDPAAMLGEARRLLAPGGRLAVLIPTGGPLTAGDRVRYASLLVALGRTALPFPRPEVVHDPRSVLEAAGFLVRADDAVRFTLPLRSAADADLFVRSLYLPAVGSRREATARRVVGAWPRGAIGLPLRVLAATATSSEESG